MTPETAAKIKGRLAAGGMTQHQIARYYGVTKYVVEDISRGKTWVKVSPVHFSPPPRRLDKWRNSSKISPETAAEIKGYLAESDLTHREIAECCDASQEIVSMISRGRNWVDVPRRYFSAHYLHGLKAARQKRGISQVDLAGDALGMYNNTHISAYENVKRRASPETMRKIAEVLDATMEELVEAPVPCEAQGVAV
jgi:transcriptional regulator with XRE-family HTH domain